MLASEGTSCSSKPASPGLKLGNARFSDCPTVPVIAPNWKIVEHIITNHHQQIQFAPKRGPPKSLRAPSVGLPDEIAYRPSSVCTKTLITQLNRINQRKTNPCLAPSDVVSSNSPEPTIVPARMIPGPIFRNAVQSEVGGSSIDSRGSA